eukprot:TRINITY_DN38068_c0_g1_i1.p1 TRINITY_DN38068_c0_g1~~TRINITY_DN38068_c0_g1_i1.p1  ORF type:complete len:327 (+),score=116.05 TRINITY_DN38068_c0_g1_i1:231-1211(+)
MDCSIVPLHSRKLKDYYLISTIDFFYPLVENPYTQGRIGCANVLSDMYSMGIDEIDNMLMVLGASKDMSEGDRFISTQQMLKGFNDLANEAKTEVTGGQSVINPWPMIGGVAIAVVHESEFISPDGLKPGNTLVLTKPLGTQVAVNLRQAYNPSSAKACGPPIHDLLKDDLTDEDVKVAYNVTSQSMEHLNMVGARLMRKHGSTGATDVTGFGILGHASNLQAAQKEEVQITLHTLPVIHRMLDADTILGSMFKLKAGFSAETSGGLLAAFPTEEAAKAFIADLAVEDKTQGWIVGHTQARVEGDTNDARIAPDVRIIDVDRFYLD